MIDYRAGELRFQWHARGESEVRYAWPEDESAINALARLPTVARAIRYLPGIEGWSRGLTKKNAAR